MVVPRDWGKPILLTHTAPYVDSADTELYPFSHYLICPLVLPWEVGREGAVISILSGTHGH